MSLFLDTNALLWWLRLERLTPSVLDQIAAEDDVFVSFVSPWEIWIKVNSGRLAIPADFEARLVNQSVRIVPPSMDDIRLAASLPMIHRDPFDRMIVAQAMNRRARVVSGDRLLSSYGVEVLVV